MIVSVVVDSREPAWVQALTFGGARDPNVEPAIALDAGDLMLATDDNAILLVERKTPSDLLRSIHDGSLFSQAARMHQVTPWSYLIVTGVLYHDHEGHVICDGLGKTEWNWNAVEGALLTVQELGVGVIHCWGDEDYEAAVIRLANRERGPVQSDRKREGWLLPPGGAMLAGLPNIGPERVKALLNFCGSAAWALTWLSDLSSAIKIPDIGDGIKRIVHQELGLADGFKLAVVTTDREEEVRNGIVQNG